MMIKNCHIENFGTISNFNYDFHQGLNQIREENSWGKTTFSVFIKSMFYGLEYNTKKVNERKMYEPWQGGTYGGSLTIEVDGREYRIERTFGKKDKDDTFAIYDVKTGKTCEDYSEKIGEELFQIDRESFVKSIYIPQCQTDTGMTDGLNAKIGNLTKVKDDISNFEQVKKQLEEKKKEYGSRGKKSRVVQLNETVKELKVKAEKRNETLQVIRALEEHIREKKQEYEKTRIEKERYNEILARQSKKIKDIALYRNALENLEKSEEKIAAIERKYHGKMIETEDVEILKKEYENIKNLNSQLQFLGVDDTVLENYRKYEKLFESGIPEERFFLDGKNQIDRLKVLNSTIVNEETGNQDRKRLEELKGFFSEKYPTAEEINAQMEYYHKADILKKEIFEEKVHWNSMPESEGRKRRSANVPMIVGALVILIGIVAGIVLRNPAGAVVAGIGFGILFFATKKAVSGKESLENTKKKDVRMAEIVVKEQQLEELEKQYKSFVQCFHVRYSESILSVLTEIKEKHMEYERLEERVAEMQEMQEQNRQEAEKILRCLSEQVSAYEKKINTGNNLAENITVYEQAYEHLKGCISEYLNLKERIEKYNAISSRLEEHVRTYREVKSIYTQAEQLDVNVLEEDYRAYQREKKTAAEWKQEMETKKEEIQDTGTEEVLSVTELQNRIRECDEQMNRVSADIHTHERDADSHYIYLEETDDIEDEIAAKYNQLNEYKEKYELIDKTISYLQQAKDNFTARYLGPMREAFANHLQQMNGMEQTNIRAEDLEIDIDLNAVLNYGSTTKSKDNLSRGYQDLVGLCIRFALVDVMYAGETPILILDDPLVNLDEKKIQHALEMIKQLSEKYQILYFTCHQSRIC